MSFTGCESQRKLLHHKALAVLQVLNQHCAWQTGDALQWTPLSGGPISRGSLLGEDRERDPVRKPLSEGATTGYRENIARKQHKNRHRSIVIHLGHLTCCSTLHTPTFPKVIDSRVECQHHSTQSTRTHKDYLTIILHIMHAIIHKLIHEPFAGVQVFLGCPCVLSWLKSFQFSETSQAKWNHETNNRV